MVPVKEALNSGAWLGCEIRDNLFESNQFRLKINSFKKVSLSKIDEPEKIKNLDNGILWLMQIEIINLNKLPLHSLEGPYRLILKDQDEFVFPPFEDDHLRYGSKFSETSGMKRFFATRLLPKIKSVGSIMFQLPDDDDAEYVISISGKNGSIQEV